MPSLNPLDTSAVMVVNGFPFFGWKKISCSQAFDQASGHADITISPQPGEPLPVTLGDDVQLLFAAQPAMTGHVRDVGGDHDVKHHDIKLSIRDKTQDFVDSTIGPKLDIDTPVTLKQVAERTLKTMGLHGIKVIDKVGAAPFKQGEKVSADIDETGHGFVDKYAQARHAVQTTDGYGNLVLDQNKGDRRASGFLHFGLPDDPLNNVTKSSFHVTEEGRFNAHAVAGQKSPNDKNFWEGRPKGEPLGQARAMASRIGVAYDPSVRPERRKHSRGGKAMEGSSPKDAAKWKGNTGRAKGNEYVAVVAGFCQLSGKLWWPGLIVPVYDYWWQLEGDLFLKSVTFSKDWGARGHDDAALRPRRRFQIAGWPHQGR